MLLNQPKLTPMNVRCPKCNANIFDMKYEVHKISKLESPTGQDELMSVPVFMCSKCGYVLVESDYENTTPKKDKELLFD